MTTIEQLLGEFIDAWNAGRRPDLDEYLRRAPEPERDELAEQLGTWLEIAPTPAYDTATLEEIREEATLVAAFAAAKTSVDPISRRLPALRAKAGLAVGELARRLTAVFDLDDEARVSYYLQRLEHDALDERRLSTRLTSALAAVLRVDHDALLPRPMVPAGQTLFRAQDGAEPWGMREIEALSQAAFAPAPDAMDEVDRLFLGGPGG